MLRRFFWTSAILALLVLSWVWRPMLERLFKGSLPQQVLMVSTLVAFAGVLLLVPLALWWKDGASVRVRRLRVVTNLLAWVAIALPVLSLLIHTFIDHGATSRYPGWDWSLGLAYFGWEHHYYFYGPIIGLFARWLLARHRSWSTPAWVEPLREEPETEPARDRVWFERMASWGQFAVAVVLLVFVLVGLQIPFVAESAHSPDSGQVPPRHMRVLEAQPLGGALEGACSLGDRVVLYRSTWVGWTQDDGSAAACRYKVRKAGVEECLLEYPVARASGLGAANVAGRLARTFLRKKYGVNGLRLHSTGDMGRLFLLLDQGSCRFGWVVSGTRLVP